MARTRPSTRTIFDDNSYLSTMQYDVEDDGQLTPLCHPANNQVETSGSFFSRFKQTFSSSPLGSILNQTNSSNSSTPPRSSSLQATKNQGGSNANSNVKQELQTPPNDSPSPTPRRLSSSKHVFTPMPIRSSSHYRSCTSSSAQSDASSSPSVAPSSCFSPMSTSSHPTLATSTYSSDYGYDYKWSPVLSSPSEIQTTPPLTPDANFDETAAQGQDPSSENVYNRTRTQRSASVTIKDDENASTRSETNKGKAPAPPFPYETLIADISSSTSINDGDNQDEDADSGEWWGLQYSIELSRRDSRASDTSSSTTGEHSKSRESWAAIHQGTIPPLYEDTNFQDWKRWHRALEKIELRRRRKRTIDFIEESTHLSSLYIDENLAQRAVHIFTDLLTPGEIYDALLWIEYTAEHRPDPYYPPEKHNLGWILKKHRSVACLRELKVSSLDE